MELRTFSAKCVPLGHVRNIESSPGEHFLLAADGNTMERHLIPATVPATAKSGSAGNRDFRNLYHSQSGLAVIGKKIDLRSTGTAPF